MEPNGTSYVVLGLDSHYAFPNLKQIGGADVNFEHNRNVQWVLLKVSQSKWMSEKWVVPWYFIIPIYSSLTSIEEIQMKRRFTWFNVITSDCHTPTIPVASAIVKIICTCLLTVIWSSLAVSFSLVPCFEIFPGYKVDFPDTKIPFIPCTSVASRKKKKPIDML